MKRWMLVSVAAILLLIIDVATFCVINITSSQSPDDKTFYIGVTYCGNSISNPKLLIDKVKSYTNMFILQSGSLQRDNSSINAIGNYAVDSGLNFIVYMGVSAFALANNWLTGYDGRW